MAALTKYLDPGLATGLNDGTSEANAFQSWANCVSDLNTNHSDMVADGDNITVQVLATSGGFETWPVAGQTGLAISCDATNFLKFVGAAADVTPGIWSTSVPGVVWGPTSGGTVGWSLPGVASGSMHITFENLAFEWDTSAYTGASSTLFFKNETNSKTAGSQLIFEGCYMRADAAKTNTGVSSFYQAQAGNITMTCNNCIFQDFTSSSGTVNLLRSTRNASEGVHLFANCTFDNMDELFDTSNATSHTRVVNCLMNDVTDATIPIAAAANTGSNAANDATTLPGSDNTNSVTFSFVNDPTDMHLSATDGNGAGTSDATYGTYVPATDIDGDSRGTSSADVGMDEFVAAAGNPILIPPTGPYYPPR
jgi:hypothetical protein